MEQRKKAISSQTNYKLQNALLKEQAEFIENYLEKLKLKKKLFYKDELEKEFNRNFRIGENIPEVEGEVVDFISFIDKYIDDRKHLEEGTHQTLRGTRKHIVLAFNLVPENTVKSK